VCYSNVLVQMST